MYAATAAPSVGPGHDSGELATAVYSLGVAHPPGYPLYVRLGHLFCSLPWSSDYGFRVNLFSAAGTAWAAAMLTWLLVRATGSAAAGLFAGLGFALLRSVWRQAVLAEVFGLHFALLASLAAAAWSTRRRLQEGRPYQGALLLVYGLLGLCLAHHHTFVLGLPGLLWLARGRFRQILWNPGWLLCLGVALGFYLDMLARAQAEPALNWGGLRQLPDLWAHFLRRAYGTFQLTTRVQRLEHGLAHAAGYGIFTGAQQAVWPWLLAAAWGLGRGRLRDAGLWGLACAWWLAMGAFFALIGRQSGDDFHLDLLERFYAGSYVGLAILAGLGAADLFRRWRAPWHWLVTGTILSWMASLNLPACRLDGRELTLSYARLLLESCPPGALLVVNGDLPVGAVDYAQKVEKIRLDVRVVCPGLLGAPWYRRRLEPQLQSWLPPAGTPEKERIFGLADRARRAAVPVVCNQRQEWPGPWSPLGVAWSWSLPGPDSREAFFRLLRDCARLGPGLGDEQRFWPRFLLSARLAGLRQHAGRLYTHEPRLALLAMDTVLQLGGRRPLDYLNRGLLRFQLGQYDAALSDFEQALKLQPDLKLAAVLKTEAEWRRVWQHLGARAAEVLQP